MILSALFSLSLQSSIWLNIPLSFITLYICFKQEMAVEDKNKSVPIARKFGKHGKLTVPNNYFLQDDGKMPVRLSSEDRVAT